MKSYLPISIFTLVEIIVVAFILSTVDTLPKTIASHFNSAGIPNGFMSHEEYTLFMLGFVVGIPILTMGIISVALRFLPTRINIPNKAYWLAVENKATTAQFLQNHITYFGILIVLFMAYLHWLLLDANSIQPPHLSNELSLIGMAGFLICMLLWAGGLVIKFMRVPKK